VGVRDLETFDATVDGVPLYRGQYRGFKYPECRPCHNKGTCTEGQGGERERERERARVCVCVCVRERERERVRP
jgi:hypothetical protein